MLQETTYSELEKFLSKERLATYLTMADNKQEIATELYLRNLAYSQELYSSLHWLEIGLRNGINTQLSEFYGFQWHENPTLFLGDREKLQIIKAKQQLTKSKKPLHSNTLIAELSFGFWVNLFNFPYETLWRHCLRKTFTDKSIVLERRTISRKIHPLLKLRNRIAHYEPILHFDLDQKRANISAIIQWINPAINIKLA